MRKLLIIGCGRSGTMYTVKLLQELGFDIQHEVMGSDGMVSWFATFEDCCCLPKEHLPPVKHSDFIILHQVRHPVETIASIQTFTERSWQRVCMRVPEISLRDPLLVRCMKYWYHWNSIAEEKAVLTYRVESLDRLDTQRVSKRINQREHSELTWADLKSVHSALCESVREVADRYGYSDWSV